MATIMLDMPASMAHCAGQLPDRAARHFHDGRPAVSFVTAGELCREAARSSGSLRHGDFKAWFRTVKVIGVDRKVAQLWGRLAAQMDGTRQPVPVEETWTAACCIANGLQLLAFDVRDFELFQRYGLRLLRG